MNLSYKPEEDNLTMAKCHVWQTMPLERPRSQAKNVFKKKCLFKEMPMSDFLAKITVLLNGNFQNDQKKF